MRTGQLAKIKRKRGHIDEPSADEYSARAGAPVVGQAMMPGFVDAIDAMTRLHANILMSKELHYRIFTRDDQLSSPKAIARTTSDEKQTVMACARWLGIASHRGYQF